MKSGIFIALLLQQLPVFTHQFATYAFSFSDPQAIFAILNLSIELSKMICSLSQRVVLSKAVSDDTNHLSGVKPRLQREQQQTFCTIQWDRFRHVQSEILTAPQQWTPATGLRCRTGVTGSLTYSNMCFQNHTNIICTIPYGECYRAPFCVLHHSHNLKGFKKKG